MRVELIYMRYSVTFFKCILYIFKNFLIKYMQVNKKLFLEPVSTI